MGLPVVGTLGILLAAKRRKLLTEVRPCLDDLRGHRFRMSAEVYETILSEAGEL